MITEANVGVGIYGREGSEASRVSDYSINQFYHLQKLLLYHGREAYRKNSYFVIYNFYKNIIFVSPMFFFGFINFFSGITLYDPFLHQLYNVFYSIFPIFYFSIFDREYEPESLLNNPKYYSQGMNNECFNIFIVIKYIFFGFIEGLLLMISSFVVLSFNNEEGYNLNNLYSNGTVIFSGIIIIVNLNVLLNSKIIDIFIVFLAFISIFTFYLGVFIFSGGEIYSFSLHKYFSYNYYILGDYSKVIKDNKYCLYLLFIIGLVIIVDKLCNQILDFISIKFEKIGKSEHSRLYAEKINNDNSSINLSKESKSEKDEFEMQTLDSREEKIMN